MMPNQNQKIRIITLKYELMNIGSGMLFVDGAMVFIYYSYGVRSGRKAPVLMIIDDEGDVFNEQIVDQGLYVRDDLDLTILGSSAPSCTLIGYRPAGKLLAISCTPKGHVFGVTRLSAELVVEVKYTFFYWRKKMFALHLLEEGHRVIDLSTGEIFNSFFPENFRAEVIVSVAPPAYVRNINLVLFSVKSTVSSVDSKDLIRWYTFEPGPPFRIIAIGRHPLLKNDLTGDDGCGDNSIREIPVTGKVYGVAGRPSGNISALIQSDNMEICLMKFITYRMFCDILTLVSWSVPNFGDLLSKMVIEGIYPEKAVDEVQCSKYNMGYNRLLGLGTIFHLAKDGDVVWGSGLGNHIKSGGCYIPEKNVEILAVRGPLTRREYINSGGKYCPEIYGDPALLLPRIYTPSSQPLRPRVMPHLYDNELAIIFRDQESIDVKDRNHKSVIDLICGSSLLITSSLHGLIVAEAYGIPVVLYLTKKMQMIEPLFKYLDYFESTQRTAYFMEYGSFEDVTKFVTRIPAPILPDLDKLQSVLCKYLSQRYRKSA